MIELPCYHDCMSLTKFLLISAAAACLSAQTPASSSAAPAGGQKPPAATPPAAMPSHATPPPAAVVPQVPPDKVVLTIGEEKMTAGEFDHLVDALPQQFRAAARGPNKHQFAEQLVRIKVLAQEAHRQKVDQTPAFQRQLELQTENLLANTYFQELMANMKVDDAAAHKYYDEHKADYETARARHILVRMKGSHTALQPGKKELTEEEALAKAQELRKKLAAGEDFAALAKTESDDTVSAAKGGDLGTFRHGQMAAEFEKAAFTQPIGQVGEPVKTQFGYHLIEVQQRDTKTFEQVRTEIEQRMRPELARAEVEKLRKEASVNMDESFFGGPPPLQPVK